LLARLVMVFPSVYTCTPKNPENYKSEVYVTH